MENLETNVAKVQIGNQKTAATCINLLAEPAPLEDTEIFGICELALLNPAAEKDCKRVSQSVFASLRRVFGQSHKINNFELALEEINESIILAAKQQEWIKHLNILLAAREGNKFYAAGSGQISALLLRDDRWQAILESGKQKTGDKVFGTLSSGELKAKDKIILTTAEIWNHTNTQRLKHLLSDNALQKGAQILAETLEESAGPSVAFGCLIMDFATPQDTISNTQSKTQSQIEKNQKDLSISDKFQILKNIKIPDVLKNKLNTLRPKTNQFSMAALRSSKTKAKEAVTFGDKMVRGALKNTLRLWKTSTNKQKTTALIALGAIFMVIGLLGFVRHNQTEQNQKLAEAESKLTAIDNLINEAISHNIFGDQATASKQLTEAKTLFSNLDAKYYPEKSQTLAEKIASFEKQLANFLNVKITPLAVLQDSKSLLPLNDGFGVANSGSLTRYSLKNSKTIEQSAPELGTINDLANLNADNRLLIYSGDSIYIWRDGGGIIGEKMFQQIPKPGDFGGLSYFSNNGKGYFIDTEKRQILSMAITPSGPASPTQWNKDPLPEGILKDMAVDGSVYILTDSGLHKFHQGKKDAGFIAGADLSAAEKIIANSAIPYIYVLEPKNQLISILEKNGKLIGKISTPELAKSTDFLLGKTPDTLYILSAGSLVNLEWSAAAK